MQGISPLAEGTLVSEKTRGIYVINILFGCNRVQSDLHKQRHTALLLVSQAGQFGVGKWQTVFDGAHSNLHNFGTEGIT
jgi:hypothetical protein